jgi:translation initiation factor 1 (eIF-1/SUI1)
MSRPLSNNRASQPEGLATPLKKRCDPGGTVRNALIEVQAYDRSVLVAEPTRLGYPVRPSGG